MHIFSNTMCLFWTQYTKTLTMYQFQSKQSTQHQKQFSLLYHPSNMVRRPRSLSQSSSFCWPNNSNHVILGWSLFAGADLHQWCILGPPLVSLMTDCDQNSSSLRKCWHSVRPCFCKKQDMTILKESKRSLDPQLWHARTGCLRWTPESSTSP